MSVLFMRAAVDSEYFAKSPSTTRVSLSIERRREFVAQLRPWALYRASSFAPRRMDQIRWTSITEKQSKITKEYGVSAARPKVVTRRSVVTGKLHNAS